MTMVTRHCKLDNYKIEVEVGFTWSLYDVKQEFNSQVGHVLTDSYQMYIISDGLPEKVNNRNERSYIIDRMLPPKLLRFIARF